MNERERRRNDIENEVTGRDMVKETKVRGKRGRRDVRD